MVLRKVLYIGWSIMGISNKNQKLRLALSIQALRSPRTTNGIQLPFLFSFIQSKKYLQSHQILQERPDPHHTT